LYEGGSFLAFRESSWSDLGRWLGELVAMSPDMAFLAAAPACSRGHVCMGDLGSMLSGRRRCELGWRATLRSGWRAGRRPVAVLRLEAGRSSGFRVVAPWKISRGLGRTGLLRRRSGLRRLLGLSFSLPFGVPLHHGIPSFLGASYGLPSRRERLFLTKAF